MNDSIRSEPGPSELTDDAELALTMSSSMAEAGNYHHYQWDLIRPFIGQRVLEIGPGFGQYTRRILSSGRQVLASDLDPRHLRELEVPSEDRTRLSLQQLDLNNPLPDSSPIRDFQPDTVILLNVLEHIERHYEALEFLSSVTSPGGNIVLLVPALNWLYNGLDTQAGHFRRYSRSTLSQAAEAAGYTTGACRYVNAPGVPGWMLAGALNKLTRQKEQLDSTSTNFLVRLYDRWFTRISRVSDTCMGKVLGLSVFYVGTKSAGET